MVVTLGHIYTQIPAREDVRELLLATQRRAREEPDCIEYVFAETLDDPGHFIVVQRWRDRAALETHYGSAGFAEYQARIGPYLTRTSELEVHAIAESVRPFDPSPIGPADD